MHDTSISVSIVPGGWRLWWGMPPLPAGAVALGVVTRHAGLLPGADRGALIRLASGVLVQGNAGAIRGLPRAAAERALDRATA
jgi:hypothetical protein